LLHCGYYTIVIVSRVINVIISVIVTVLIIIVIGVINCCHCIGHAQLGIHTHIEYTYISLHDITFRAMPFHSSPLQYCTHIHTTYLYTHTFGLRMGPILAAKGSGIIRHYIPPMVQDMI